MIPPDACNVVVSPGQIVLLLPAFALGKGFTVIVTFSVEEQPYEFVTTTE